VNDRTVVVVVVVKAGVTQVGLVQVAIEMREARDERVRLVESIAFRNSQGKKQTNGRSFCTFELSTYLRSPLELPMLALQMVHHKWCAECL